jgi:hypothetical protein
MGCPICSGSLEVIEMISDKEAEKSWDDIFDRSECINRLKEITRERVYDPKIGTYLRELLYEVWRSYVFGTFCGCIILSGSVLDIALTQELLRIKDYPKENLNHATLGKLIRLAKDECILREAGEYLFSINEKFEGGLNKCIISEELKSIFKNEKFPHPVNVTIKEYNGWELKGEHKNYNKTYNVKKENGKLNVYLDIAYELNNLRNKYAHPSSIEDTDIRVKNQTADWDQSNILIDGMKPDAKKAVEYIHEILLKIYPKQKH